LTVNRRRGRKNDAADIPRLHGLQQTNGSDNIYVIIQQRIRLTFADSFERGKMNYSVDSKCGERRRDGCCITNICLDNWESFTCQPVQSIGHIALGITKIIQNNNLMAAFTQSNRSMGADIAVAARQ
jgi:hypothetical protein